jgi:hypothetical protein
MSVPLIALMGRRDIVALEVALRSACAEIGSLSHLHIATASQGGKRQALCFFRMEALEQERRAMLELGAGRAGDELVLVVNLHSEKRAHASLAVRPAHFMNANSKGGAPC